MEMRSVPNSLVEENGSEEDLIDYRLTVPLHEASSLIDLPTNSQTIASAGVSTTKKY